MFGPQLLLAVCALVATTHVAVAYIPTGAPSYTDLRNFTGQWNIAVYLNRDLSNSASAYVRHTCNATAYGAACNQPTLQEHTNAAVKIVFAPRDASRPFQTWNGGVPEEIIVRLNYMPVSQVDRGWRKKNQAYPSVGFHAKWEVAKLAFTAAGGEAVWNLGDADEVTDGLLYPEVCVSCRYPDGKTEYCACDRLNGPSNTVTVETSVEGSITPAMRGSAIALSAFAPLFLIAYLLLDHRYYNKHGKALQVVHLEGQ